MESTLNSLEVLRALLTQAKCHKQSYLFYQKGFLAHFGLSYLLCYAFLIQVDNPLSALPQSRLFQNPDVFVQDF